MFEVIKVLTRGVFNLFGFACPPLYVGLVLMAYATEGSRYELTFDPRQPFRSTKRILVGLGVRAAAAILRMGKAALDILFETSAQVGEWFTQRSSPTIQARIRSRFS